MSANQNPIFPLTPNLGQAAEASANTNRDGTGALATLLTAGAAGSRVECVHLHATVTTVAGLITLFVTQGGVTILVAEIPVTAVTPSATVAAWSADWFPPRPLILPASALLKMGNTVAQNVVGTVYGGDY